jgi:hypothetical protein
MFCRSLFVLLYFFLWPLLCLFFDIRIMIIPLVSSMFVLKVHHFLCTVLVVFIITFVFPGDFYSLYKNMLYNYILPPEIWDVLTGAPNITGYTWWKRTLVNVAIILCLKNTKIVVLFLIIISDCTISILLITRVLYRYIIRCLRFVKLWFVSS